MIYDENGRAFPSLKAACKAHSIPDGGHLYTRLRAYGEVRVKGHVFTEGKLHKDETNTQLSASDISLLRRMKERYEPDELERIASGEGLARPIEYPKIVLTGKHHRMMVISDTHIGSKYSPYVWHELAARTAREERCECVLHCGDLTEGVKTGRVGSQMYELTDLGFEAQRDRAIELMSEYKIPIYIISGNHDAFFQENTGADIVQAVADKVPGMVYLGYGTADIEVDGANLCLWHGGDGNSYALSYRLQKIVETFTGGTKPAILLAGHVHKFCYFFDRNVHAVSVPTMQMQTKWMRDKRLAAHTGFLILDFDVEDGCVCNLSVRLFPFYA